MEQQKPQILVNVKNKKNIKSIIMISSAVLIIISSIGLFIYFSFSANDNTTPSAGLNEFNDNNLKAPAILEQEIKFTESE